MKKQLKKLDYNVRERRKKHIKDIVFFTTIIVLTIVGFLISFSLWIKPLTPEQVNSCKEIASEVYEKGMNNTQLEDGFDVFVVVKREDMFRSEEVVAKEEDGKLIIDKEFGQIGEAILMCLMSSFILAILICLPLNLIIEHVIGKKKE